MPEGRPLGLSHTSHDYIYWCMAQPKGPAARLVPAGLGLGRRLLDPGSEPGGGGLPARPAQRPQGPGRKAGRPNETQGIETTHEDIQQGSDSRVEQKLSLELPPG